MATKKDLVEAYSFSRRRLVTAFVSGAPGGREVEPTKPGRAIVGGLALAVLLMAGAAIAGIFTTNVDPAWSERPGLIVSEEDAAVYVITESSSDAVLHPVLNITSAKLILGSDEEPQVIPDDYIARERLGSDVGIFGAPPDVPDVSRLIPSGWTACAVGDRLRLSVSEEQLVTPVRPEEHGGLLVSVGQGTARQLYALAVGAPDDDGRTTARSYLVPQGPLRDALLRGLGLPPAVEARPVSQSWLDLFPVGGELSRDAFDVDPGAPPMELGGRTLAVGSVVRAPGATFLVTQRGLEELSPFAEVVYRSGDGGPVREVELDRPPAGSYSSQAYRAAGWPSETLTPVLGEACVRLVTEPGESPRLELVRDPEGDASVESAAGRSASVDDGAGAYVLAGGWDDTDTGQPFVIDAKGYAYPLGSLSDADQLGYGGYPAPVVPDSWVELFTPGVELSRNAALCEPRVGADPCA